MTESDVASAAYWAAFWSRIETWAFAGVVITLAIEFAALKFGAPYKEAIENSKDLEIAQLNNETARLRKELEPRIVGEEFSKALAGKPKPALVEILYVRDAPSALTFSFSLLEGLSKAGWPVSGPLPIKAPPVSDNPRLSDLSSAMAVSGQPTGVTIVSKEGSTREQVRGDTPMAALIKALTPELTGLGFARDPSMPPDVIRVVVAPGP